MKILFDQEKRNGLSQEFYPKGQLLAETAYVNDVKHGDEKSYFADGTPNHEAHYVHGKLEGLSRRWNEKGVLVFEGEYKEGMRHGKFNKYFEDGKPMALQTFTNDQAHGFKKSYDAKGICTESKWESGKKV
jgi:antitoxin component YwqK of YwqJK toxin-antitoxin module